MELRFGTPEDGRASRLLSVCCPVAAGYPVHEWRMESRQWLLSPQASVCVRHPEVRHQLGAGDTGGHGGCTSPLGAREGFSERIGLPEWSIRWPEAVDHGESSVAGPGAPAEMESGRRETAEPGISNVQSATWQDWNPEKGHKALGDGAEVYRCPTDASMDCEELHQSWRHDCEKSPVDCCFRQAYEVAKSWLGI